MERRLPVGRLEEGIRELLSSSDYSDLTIVCGKRQWKAHKSVLCTQSEWFRTACKGPFKEGMIGVIDFVEDDPDAVEAMIRALYGYDYCPERSADEQDRSPVLDLRVHALADKYLLQSLKDLAKASFAESIKATWSSDGFADAISEVFNPEATYDEYFQTMILEVAAEHVHELFMDGLYSQFQATANSNLQFSSRLNKTLASRSTSPRELNSDYHWYKCQGALCSSNPTVFAVAKDGQPDWTLSCPKRCNHFANEDRQFWEAYTMEKK